MPANKELERCIEQAVAFRWVGETLETTSVRDATVCHPVSATESWFNQLPHWHQRCLHAEGRGELLALLGKDRVLRGCRFGDGGERAVACHAGDVLIVDNVCVAHGRNPFVGRREVLVAMGRRPAA